MTQIKATARCRASGRFGGFGPWRVRVLDGDRVLSTHCCWSLQAAAAYAAVLRWYWPGFRVSVRRPGRRREVTS
jgi:hypothetical protein